jgi:hypothetical protein
MVNGPVMLQLVLLLIAVLFLHLKMEQYISILELLSLPLLPLSAEEDSVSLAVKPVHVKLMVVGLVYNQFVKKSSALN